MTGPLTALLAAQAPAADEGLPAQVENYAVFGAIFLGAIVAGLVAHSLAFLVLRRVLRTRRHEMRGRALRRLHWPSRVLLPLVAVLFVLPSLDLGEDAQALARHGLSVALILSVTWLLVNAISGLDDLFLSKYDISARDNLMARRVHTQTRVISRTMMVIVGIAGVGMALMTFPSVRQFGVSVLASAGIAGLVVGMAARPTLSNLIAGIQIALTQPIRLDDVVIVEGEWGRVEEITATYVVVKIWDERRLVVPLNYFIEQPIQNWTRTSAELLGTVFLHCDYRVPLDELREELKRLCESSEEWDERVCLVQVTDTTERTMQVRALVSAADSGSLWNLRCKVREGLLTYLQKTHPDSLPRVRVEGSGEGLGAGGAAG